MSEGNSPIREVMPDHAHGRRPTSGQGVFGITKYVSRSSAVALLRGNPPLHSNALDARSLVLHLIRDLDHFYDKPHIPGNQHENRFVRLLWEMMSLPELRSPPATDGTFACDVRGYLRMWLRPRWARDHLELFIDDGVEYSIINGCWVNSHALGVLQNREENLIWCIMLDTTWSVLRQYVTAIMIAVSRNTAIRLDVAFGRVENFELYEMFWSIFEREFGRGLSSLILVFDLGSGLWKFARRHDFRQRICLGHFLAALKGDTFSVFVHYLVKVCTDYELEMRLIVYRGPLHAAIQRDPSDGSRRGQSEFAKASLSVRYREDERSPRIEIADGERSAQVSSIFKTLECIPELRIVQRA
jgi:hypothetical protein